MLRSAPRIKQKERKKLKPRKLQHVDRKKTYTKVSQKFCNIFVCASLGRVYHVTKAVKTIVGNHCVY